MLQYPNGLIHFSGNTFHNILKIFNRRYDNHREQILRGSHTNYEDSSLDVFQYFTVSCYKGFGDDAGGFYAIYGEVFDKIATEDIEFMDNPEEFEGIPKFGNRTANYEDVVGPFYAYWQSYSTRKTYAWLCPHNVSEYRDRRILREIEKETKKIAQKAKKERNDEIRALVAFVRKRDKRVQEYKKVLEERAEQNRVKQQMHRLQQLKRNKEEAEAMNNSAKSCFNTSDHEEQLRQLEQAYCSDSDYDDESCEGEEEELEEGDEEELVEGGADNECDTNSGDANAEELLYVDDLYCVACNKAFKNESSYENHESSKKHRENTEKLKKKLQAEEKLFEKANHDVEDVSGGEDDLGISDECEQDAAETALPEQRTNKKNKKSKTKKQQIFVAEDPDDDEHEINGINQPLADVNIGNTSDHDDAWTDDNKKGKRGKNKKAQTKATATKQTEASAAIDETTQGSNGFVEEPSKKVSKGKAKKIEKSVRVAPADLDPNLDISHTCVTCNSVFDSKNKLFNHLKKANHGVYLPKTTVKVPTESNAKKGKQK